MLRRVVAFTLGIGSAALALAANAATGDVVSRYIEQARADAGDLYTPVQQHLCFLHSPEDDARLAARRKNAPLQPTRVFDNLYYVGAEEVSSWALTTSNGIILFDALNNEGEAKEDIVDGMRRLGLDPMSIKYIVLTHGHGDHFGGATYLKNLTGAKILASSADTALIQNTKLSRGTAPNGSPLTFPDVDEQLADGQTLSLGDASVKFYLTPGHTPGSLSSIFRVYDHGRPHTLAFWGGVGVPNNAAALAEYIQSDARFAAAAADADVAITNHPHADMSLEWVARLHDSHGGKNPEIVGPANVARWFAVVKDCALAQQARIQEGLPAMGRPRREPKPSEGQAPVQQ